MSEIHPPGSREKCGNCGRRLSERTAETLVDGDGCPFCREEDGE